VESPIRFGKHSNIKTVFVFILMVTIGLVSYDSYKNNRVSHATSKVQSLFRQIEWEIPVATQEQKDLCRKMFPDRTHLTPRGRDDNFCFIKNSSSPNVLIIGDSMSFSLFPGLNKYDDINTLVLSASMAAPFYNTRTSSAGDASRFYNYKLTNQALDYALNNENIKVVIMTFMHGPYLTDSKFDYEITNIQNPNSKDLHRNFTEALTSTLSKLRAKNKHVIYVLPNPILYYDITSCLNSYRPFTLTKRVEKLCAQSSSEYLKNGGREYRGWVTSVLKKFPEVKVFDMTDFLCDKKLCWGMKDGRILYRDVSHLSIDGSEFIAPFLISEIREALGSDTSVVR
jgi:type VI protein secretion system component Hcp